MVARVTITPELFVSSNMLQHIAIEYYYRVLQQTVKMEKKE